MRMLILCPSRGRPHRITEMLSSFDGNKGNPKTDIAIYVATDDPHLEKYRRVLHGRNVTYGSRLEVTHAINRLYEIHNPGYDYYGIANDDYVYRTKDWDIILAKAIDWHCGGWGMATAKPLHPENFNECRHPVGCVFSANVPNTLGHIFHPCIKLYRSDTYLRDLFDNVGNIHVPEVIIEHVHYRTGQVPFDDTYALGYTPDVCDAGNRGIDDWHKNHRDLALNRIREARMGICLR